MRGNRIYAEGFEEVTEKIDFVMLWVDGNDPQWQRRRALYSSDEKDNGSAGNRFRDWGLLRYWFRGVERFAPWVNRIFFVTDGQVPSWLNREHPRLRLVSHKEYIPEKYLPTFNSNVIELWMHRIPDLGEHFVLFNDDVYLTAPVLQKDFFRNGLPVESALLDLITATDPEDCFPYILNNIFAVINSHFDKKQVIRKNAGKFFTVKYGADLVRNLLLFPFQYFSCFRDLHITSSYCKSTFVKVWEEEGDLLEQCGRNRFRSKSDLSHWLMKSWQICEGNFYPRSRRWGRHFELGDDDLDLICRSIEKEKYRAVCLNDSSEWIDFDSTKARLEESFARTFPACSQFEIYR